LAYFSQVGRLILHDMPLEILQFRHERYCAVGLMHKIS